MGRLSADKPHSLRVVLVNCEGVLGDIITHALTEAPDMDVVARFVAADFEAATLVAGADIVLWNDADEQRLQQLIAQEARRHAPRVVATLHDGRNAAMWQIVPRRTPLGELSPTSMIEAIRCAAADVAEDTA